MNDIHETTPPSSPPLTIPQPWILIVEDEGVIASHITRIVTQWGCQVIGPVSSGEAAIQAVEQSPPDLILMDIKLNGELSGIETATRIRARFDVPIIYITGYTENSLIREATFTAPYGYLVKPVREPELHATLQTALHRHKLEVQLKTLHAIDRAILAAESPQEIGQAALTYVRRLIPCQRASLVAYDEEIDTCLVLAVDAEGDTQLEAGTSISLDGASEIDRLRRGEARCFQDLQAIPHPSPTVRALLQEGIHSYTNVPLLFQDQLLGSLNLGSSESTTYTSEQLEIARQVADSLAVALHNARLYGATQQELIERENMAESLQLALKEARQREAEISALLKGSRAVLRQQEFTPTARIIFDVCKDLIGATSGYVALLTPDGAENEVLFLESGGLPCTVDPELPMPIRGLRETAYRTKSSVYHNDFHHSEWAHFMPEGHVQLDNVMFAPLVIEERAVGLIGLANKEDGFTDDDAHIAQAFGEMASIALINSRALEALEESEEKFRSVIEQSRDGFTLTDEQGIVIQWNRAMEEITGLMAPEALGRPIWDVQFQPSSPAQQMDARYDQIKGMTQEALATGQAPWLSALTETEYQLKTGDRLTIQISIFPIKTERGFMLGSISRDVTEQKEVQAQIEAALHEKELLLKEIHHRVKNNLAIVSSLLEFQAEGIESEEAQTAFQESQNRIHSMGRIHELLYRSGDLARVDMEEYLRQLVDHLRDSYGAYRVALDVEAGDVALDIDRAIPCGLIVNELVSNSLKHAFPNGQAGHIHITFRPHDDHTLHLVVSDDGQGMPPGVDWQNLPSLGMRLIFMLTRQLRGHVEVDSQDGTRVEITFAQPDA